MPKVKLEAQSIAPIGAVPLGNCATMRQVRVGRFSNGSATTCKTDTIGIIGIIGMQIAEWESISIRFLVLLEGR